jgi:D-lactate dehydrogenase
VSIDTGALLKALRGRRAGPVTQHIAMGAARHFAGLSGAVRLGLGAADALHGLAGTDRMQGAMASLRRASGERLPKWSPALPRSQRFIPRPAAPADGERLVYFPSCVARNMGPQRDQASTEMLPTVAERLFRHAGFEVVYPAELDSLCCGQPFESKGLTAAADLKSTELEAALAEASRKPDGSGHWPIVFDTSPCAYRMKKFLDGRLPVHDSIEFVHDQVLPRLTLTPQPGPVAIHPVCSLRKMGGVDKLMAIAAQCSAQVVSVDAVQCCGFAGDRGFVRPELNEHALRHLRAGLPADCDQGYSSSRTCEIGLSEAAGLPYQSILYLVARCAR